MSDTGLMFNIDEPKGGEEFPIYITLLIIHGRASDRGDGFRPVNGLPFGILEHESLLSGVVNLLSDFI